MGSVSRAGIFSALAALAAVFVLAVACDLAVCWGADFSWWPLRGLRLLSNPAFLLELAAVFLVGYLYAVLGFGRWPLAFLFSVTFASAVAEVWGGPFTAAESCAVLSAPLAAVLAGVFVGSRRVAG